MDRIPLRNESGRRNLEEWRKIYIKEWKQSRLKEWTEQ